MAFKLPDGIDLELWQEFEAHRKDIGRDLTDRARTLSANKLLKLTATKQRETVERTIESGWTGLFPQKDEITKPNRLAESASGRASRIWRERNGDSENPVRKHESELRGAVSGESGRREDSDILGTVLVGEYRREES